MKVSILICSFAGSQYLSRTTASIISSFPSGEYEMELLVDNENKKTGLANTTRRFMGLFEKSTGDIIVKSDDDVLYYHGWFEQCINILLKDKTIGYISPISHRRMVQLGIRHAKDPRIPVMPEGYSYENVTSGMCWIFKRELWEKIPYSKCSYTWRLDGHYSALVRDHGYKIAALNGALISHLAQDRYKGVRTDAPGRPPSKRFMKRYPEENFNIY